MTEDQLEREALGWLKDVGYAHLYGPDIAHDGAAPARTTAAPPQASRWPGSWTTTYTPNGPSPACASALRQAFPSVARACPPPLRPASWRWSVLAPPPSA